MDENGGRVKFVKDIRDIDYEQSPFFLRDSRASEMRARVKIILRETRLGAALPTASRLSRVG